jgi:hypothetical protein
VTPMGEAGGGELLDRGSAWVWLVTQGGVAFLLGRGYRTTANPQPGLMDDDLRFFLILRGATVSLCSSQRPAARLFLRIPQKREMAGFGGVLWKR